jgi:hypothetical protein
MKNKELNKMMRHQTLAPLDNTAEPKPAKEKIPKSPEHKDDKDKYVKGFRRDERGKEKKGNDFTDQPLLGDEKAKIYGLKIWTNSDKISGIQAFYLSKSGKKIEGTAHVKDQNAKAVLFEVNPAEDYIKEISGFIDRAGGVLECLILTSFKGESQKVGVSQKSSKLFKFDINEMEYPACIYGSMKGIFERICFNVGR